MGSGRTYKERVPIVSKSKILLVEEDENLAHLVLRHVRDAGYAADWIRDGGTALGTDPAEYGLWILDLMLPRVFGLDVLKQVRTTSDIPIIIMSGQVETHVKVRALQMGCDDYLTKPFWPEELIARVEARLRRPNAVHRNQIVVGELLLDLEGRRAILGGIDVMLTRVEFDLLAQLTRRRGGAIQRGWLAEKVLDPAREGTQRTLDVHVSRLRKKLGSHAGCVVTVFGIGYRFDENGAR
ncbi:MAG: response regulator transcription factor [Planctomycetota bacterium]|nr:response regulator transcription factor [Planctomycetota bacterium]